MPRVATLALALVMGAISPIALGQPAEADLSEQTLYELLLGEVAAQRNEPALAARTFIDVAKRTRDPRIARRAVEVANAAKLPDLALEAARAWQSIEPASPQALQVLAALLISAKRVEEAEPYIEKLLAADGVNVENGFMQINRLLSGNPDKQSNLRVVRQLAAKYPGVAQAHFAVAQAAATAGDDAAALAAVRQASALRPEWELAAIFEAQLLQKRSPAEASRRLGAFVEKYPNSREARLNYARALVMEKRFPEARKQFEALLASNPGNPDVVYAVGVLAFQLKDYATAEENMKRLLGLNYRDPQQARYILGQIAEEQKQWDQAIQWYQQIDSGEQALPARIRTASVMAKQGKVDEAIQYLRKVEPDGPGDEVQLTVAEAQVLRDANRTPDAYKLLEDALRKDPDQPDLLYDAALTAEKLDRFDVLESNLRKLIEIRPDHAHAYNALGYSLADRNTRLPEARKLVERALELAPEDAFIIDSLGWVLYRQGDLKGATRELRRAYNGRQDADIAAHLGEVLWVSGDRAEAARVWREALEASPDNDTLLKTIKRLAPAGLR
ncbi:MAG: tetratricopeptide repeat protein [Betaproteobacteria bacterium]|nr:tetratricopeptide repeat protein [Betaproteobacteria bacterium]